MVNYYEKVGSEGPGRSGFSYDGSRAEATYFIDSDDLEDAIVELIGSVKPAGDGSLTRELPRAHPRFAWLYCSRISNVVGIGSKSIDNEDAVWGLTAADEELEAPTITDQFWEHGTQALSVEFTPRPYAVLSDDAIPVEEITYVDDDGLDVTATCAREYYRYTDYEIHANPQLITFQQGQMKLRRADTAAPDGYPFSGFPQIYLSRVQIKFRWYQVPYRWIDSENSRLVSEIGKINQTQFMKWPAGSLLYLGFTAKRYVPPVPDKDQWFEGAFSTEKVCDVELNFDYTKRSTPSQYEPVQGNWIAAGHNLMPWSGDRRFYYASTTDGSGPSGTDTDETAWYPTFLSVPFELLFTDPDVD